jgi:hypothetical protein
MTLVGIPGGLVVANQSFGGGLDVQLSIFVLGASVFTALGMGVYNIWKLQIDQHRKWMLRAMVWMAAIVTDRIWMGVLAISLPKDGFYAVCVFSSIQTIMSLLRCPYSSSYRCGRATRHDLLN